MWQASYNVARTANSAVLSTLDPVEGGSPEHGRQVLPKCAGNDQKYKGFRE